MTELSVFGKTKARDSSVLHNAMAGWSFKGDERGRIKKWQACIILRHDVFYGMWN